jgi:putative DNA methylase
MGVSTHIRTKGARLFDTIIVARKKSSTGKALERVQWEKLKDEIYITARNAIARVRKSHPNLTNGDIATIILGKCLEIYSKNYPNVLRGESPLKVSEAFKDIRDIISELYTSESIPISDRITEFYLRHLSKKSSIEYNELLKIVQSSEFGTSIDELKNINLLTSRGNYLVVVDPAKRGKWLYENQDPKRRKLGSYIDAAHYLYFIFKKGKRLPSLEELGDFSRGVMTSLLTYMASELKDNDYKKILDLIRVADETPKGLERFM